MMFIPYHFFCLKFDFLKYLVERQKDVFQGQSDLGLHCLHIPLYWRLQCREV